MTSGRLPDVRRFLRARSLLDVDFPWPDERDSDTAVNGAYGTGHFVISCLVKRYGLDATFTFFERRVRNRRPDDEASRAAFGGPWRPVSMDCADWIHKSTGVPL